MFEVPNPAFPSEVPVSIYTVLYDTPEVFQSERNTPHIPQSKPDHAEESPEPSLLQPRPRLLQHEPGKQPSDCF